jgi:hypothetical protein
MATKMTLKELKPLIRHEKKEYIVEREVKALKKELQNHINTPMSKAHKK